MIGATTHERPLGELFSELAHESAGLVKGEIDLAKVEMRAKAKEVAHDAVVVAIGGAVAGLGSMALLAFLILVLGEVMPLWGAALLVGLVVSGAGGALLYLGLTAFQRVDPAPRRTIRTMVENKQWLMEQRSR